MVVMEINKNGQIQFVEKFAGKIMKYLKNKKCFQLQEVSILHTPLRFPWERGPNYGGVLIQERKPKDGADAD